MHNYQDKLMTLTPFARHIILTKGTERPHFGHYNELKVHGRYLCRRCGLALFQADAQFSAGCGWPSFDVALDKAVVDVKDKDGLRIEILCARCDAHLGHVFEGEQFTSRNRRYCVNATSLDFVVSQTVCDTRELIVAGGCFWGIDYYLRRLVGVVGVEVGYCGGTLDNPSYNDVCQGQSGHYEAVRVLYDIAVTDCQSIYKRFFEIHDPTDGFGQGPDRGQQYQSAIFYSDETERETALALIYQLKERGYGVVTRLLPACTFWKAEASHQDYYTVHAKAPYCHTPVSRFV